MTNQLSSRTIGGYSWLSKALLAALVSAIAVGGFAGGLALSRGVPAAGSNPGAATAISAASAGSDDLAEVVQRFPLTAADMKETLESAALAVTANGYVHLAWASRTNKEVWTLYLTTSQDRGATFSPPRVVAESSVHRVPSKMRGKTITRDMRMLPRLAAQGNDLLLAWIETAHGNTHVQYLVARSTDGGQTFAEPVAMHQDSHARPTYTSFAAGPEGLVAASWLDHRTGMQQPAATVTNLGHAASPSEITLQAGDGKGVCPCCPTNVTFAADGTLLLAFRNQQDGYRDIWIARQPPGSTTFEPPAPIVPPRWKFDGCPHDGPALAIAGNQLHVAWMDASSGKPRVHFGSGDLNLKDFTFHEANPASTGAQGHPALVAGADRALHLVWDEGASPDAQSQADAHAHGEPGGGETSRSIVYRRSSAGDDAPLVGFVAAAKDGFQLRPAIATSPQGDVYVAWVELTEDGKSIAVARLQ